MRKSLIRPAKVVDIYRLYTKTQLLMIITYINYLTLLFDFGMVK